MLALGLVAVGVGALRHANALDATLLGEERAQALGFRTGRIRLLIFLSTVLLTGLAVSVAGIVGFIGLIVPHMARLLTGARHRVLLPLTMALGAVVLKRLVEQAVEYFDYVDIIESHHEAKIDAPSGFAMNLAKSIGDKRQFTRNVTERENMPGTRGGEYNGVTIHSIRMPGRSAHHEVILGALGQTVTLRHDTLGRDCYMPGVVRCIREVVNRRGLVVGLENILGL